MSQLNPLARRVLRFIIQRTLRDGFPPTLREIGDAVGMSSTNGVRYYLGLLQADGLIERRPGLRRAVRVMPKATRWLANCNGRRAGAA